MVSLIDRRRLCAGAVAAAALPAVAAQGRNEQFWRERLAPAEVARARVSEPPLGQYSFSSTPTSDSRTSIAKPANTSSRQVQQFSWTCRDYRRSEWEWIHPILLDLLFVLHWKYNKDEINIFSGYRTPETNANIEGAALRSQHTWPRRSTSICPNVDNAAVAEDFKKFIYGGVGMYPLKHFTHLDCGPLRNWVG